MANDQNDEFLQQHAGKWVAWDRQQTHVVASAETFEQVKSAAAQAGERSVLVAKIPARASWFQRSHKLLYVFAVFIALGQPQPNAPLAGAATHQGAVADDADDDSSDDDLSVDKRWSDEHSGW
jgi:hypothetical protein